MSVALVTGATGLVGSHIVERLLAEGWTVRALVRSPDAARLALPEAVELAAGDVLDEASFTHAAAGAHVVFHTAATIIARGGWDTYRITNVEGTANAITAASRAGARLLHVSSIAVYGSSARYDAARRGGKTDEDTPLTPLPERALYARSKRESEALVLRAHAQGKAWTTAVRPDVIYGNRDRQFVPRVARLLSLGVPVPLLRGGRNVMAIVHAANVAQGAVLAATTDIAGGRAWNLANDFDVTARRFFELGGEGLGKPTRFVPVPMWLASGALGLVSRTLRALFGFSLVSRSSVNFIAEDNPFSSERAKRELGWRPSVRPEHGIPEAFRSWAEKERARFKSRPR